MNDEQVINALQSLTTIRQRAAKLLSLARQNKSAYFYLDETKMATTADYVIEVIYENYPDLEIPYHSRWRHFEVGGIDRCKLFVGEESLGKIKIELVIIAVFMDAGAGENWRYYEQKTGQFYTRSEGLALASFDLYRQGRFSVDAKAPWRVDAASLLDFSEASLGQGFQVSTENPLLGLQGRLALLHRLGVIVKDKLDGRLGNFYTYLLALAENNCLAADKLFDAVLTTFSFLWPERLRYHGVSLGDVWQHQALLEVFMPFHKLSQWLTYSLIEPLEQSGMAVTDLEKLTALAEYRNGGLLIDTGLLCVKNEKILHEPQAMDSEVIVEWRALTIALIDELAAAIRQRLKLSAKELPLAKILQGGTWDAGRRIAKQKRAKGIPPITVVSDGTLL